VLFNAEAKTMKTDKDLVEGSEPTPFQSKSIIYQTAPPVMVSHDDCDDNTEGSIGNISSVNDRFTDKIANLFSRFGFKGYSSLSKNEYNDDDIAPAPTRRECLLKSIVLTFCCGVLFGVPLFFALGKHASIREQEPAPFIYDGELHNYTGGNTRILDKLKAISTIRNVTNGAVAADHPVCSEIGLSILRDHEGNAVDAAVATALCLGVANPSSSGIGGGAFILLHVAANQQDSPQDLLKFHDARHKKTEDDNEKGFLSDKITEVIDCRETAGAAASTHMFDVKGVASDASLRGGLAVAVPGELRGLELAHSRHGILDWATVVRPAMELARNGVPVYEHLASDIESMQNLAKKRDGKGLDGLKKLLTHDNNWANILRQGDILRNPNLADTLQNVMKQGANAIYTGEVAEQLAHEIQEAGGILTREDIESYLPTLRSPVISERLFNRWNIVGVPPPSSGGAVIVGALRFLSGYDNLGASVDTLTVHRLNEAMKHVFAIRMSMGDPAFPLGNPVTNATTQDAVDALVGGRYMEELRQASRDDSIQNISHYGGPKFAQLKDKDGQMRGKDAKEGDRRTLVKGELRDHRQLLEQFGYLEDRGTSHFSVVDRWGNSVAMTTTVNTHFGSKIVTSGGFILNNEMDDFGKPGGSNQFGLKPFEANFIKPGKKPLSSMAPTMVFQNGTLVMSLGASGGPKIISATLQVILAYLIHGMELFESIAYPRIHNQLLYHGSADTTVENSIAGTSRVNLRVSDRTRVALEERGNVLLDIDYAGTTQAIVVDPETRKMTAVSDIRKGGSPAGY